RIDASCCRFFPKIVGDASVVVRGNSRSSRHRRLCRGPFLQPGSRFGQRQLRYLLAVPRRRVLGAGPPAVALPSRPLHGAPRFSAGRSRRHPGRERTRGVCRWDDRARLGAHCRCVPRGGCGGAVGPSANFGARARRGSDGGGGAAPVGARDVLGQRHAA
ncbi:hypothetical protein T484DRAFT_2027245, partial [Baffinella frigidus]